MVTVTVKCRHCGSENLIKNGFAPNGKQKYMCKDCKKASREQPESNAYNGDFKEMVLRACQERSSLRGASRTFGVHRHTISRWQEEKKRASTT
ncbi:MAG: IS1 family transposase [Myxococcales bacterium]|nr:IS1 family transposase [Myxococcales bacterium]